MGSNRNVRLVDIANDLGYTVNTVSRALRDKSDISEETKIKVRERALEMGYIPNSIASSLRSGITKTIAIVFDNMVNPYFMIMADKIHKILEASQYATMIFGTHDGKFRLDALNPIISRKVDGIITFLEPSEEVIKICDLNKIPMVLVGRKNTALKIDSVSTDDYLGGFEVGKLLVKCGATNIGYIGAPKEIECSVRRLNGLTDSLEELGIMVQKENLRFTLNVSEDLEILLRNQVDGIFCFNDVMALEVITILNEKGILVPKDIKVVGFDDIGSEFFIPIKLTTVASDKDKIILSAVQMILDKIQNGEINYKHVDFDVKLKLGNTT